MQPVSEAVPDQQYKAWVNKQIDKSAVAHIVQVY